MRKVVYAYLPGKFLEKVTIDRNNKMITVNIFTNRVGIIFKKNGDEINHLKKLIKTTLGRRHQRLFINVLEVKKATLSAQLVANQIAHQIENRQSFRIVQKKAITSTLKAGALGMKTCVAGRLGGVDMARTEGYSRGKIPLATFRSNIDYAKANAYTKYGMTGVKV